MNDLISRQAAIDDLSGKDPSQIWDTADVEVWVNALPSAQPDPHWIPCGERLPESDERVLVYTVANEYHVWDAMTHRGQDYAWEDEEGLYHNLYEVEMWMPLPEPYQ